NTDPLFISRRPKRMIALRPSSLYATAFAVGEAKTPPLRILLRGIALGDLVTSGSCPRCPPDCSHSVATGSPSAFGRRTDTGFPALMPAAVSPSGRVPAWPCALLPACAIALSVGFQGLLVTEIFHSLQGE